MITAVLIGFVLGVGMGFRRDMAALVPLAILVLCTCRLQPVRRAHRLRLAAAAALALTFALSSLPILAAFHHARWINAHDLTMGFSSRCDEELGLLAPASYERNHTYHDTYAAWQAHAMAYHRISMTGDAWERVLTASAAEQLNLISQAYIRAVVRLFPSDMLTRAYAATLRCTVGIRSSTIPFLDVFEIFGLLSVLLSLLFIAATGRWKAWQILLMLCCFCGYTSLQFGMRHAFHLSFVPYLFGSLVLFKVYAFRQARKREGRKWLDVSGAVPAIPRVALWLLLTFLTFYLPLQAARWIQRGRVEQIATTYRSAKRVPLDYRVIPDWTGETLIAPVDRYPCSTCNEDAGPPLYRMRVLVARFRESQEPLDLKLAYEWSNSGGALSGPLRAHTRPGIPTGNLDVYFTSYETATCDAWNRFAGLLMPDEQARRFVDFHEITDPGRLGFLFTITVPEHDEAFVQLQGLRVPWPHTPPIQYPWPMEAYLYQNDGEILHHLHAGDMACANSLAEAALAERPGSIHAQALLARVLLEDNREPEAWRLIQSLLADHGGDYAVYHRLDMLFQEAGDIDGRHAAWRRIVEDNPEDACARAYLERAEARQAPAAGEGV